MSYKKVVKTYTNNEILCTDVDTSKGFIVGKYDSNRAFIIIYGDWYIIEKDRIFANSSTHRVLKFIFDSENEQYSKDVRQYDNFFEASQYINEIIGEHND
jgi:hypothetical protein